MSNPPHRIRNKSRTQFSSAGRAFWEAAGYDVVSHRRIDTPNIYEETETTAYDLARAADVPTADAVLISGTGLPTIGYGPDMKGSVYRSVNAAGGIATRDEQLVIDVVKP